MAIIAGDFNKTNLKTPEAPPTCQATRGRNTLDHVYSDIKHGYRTLPLPHFSESDHLSLLLIPAYNPLRCRSRPTTKTVTTWPENTLSELQNCSNKQTGIYLNSRTWKHTQGQFWTTLSSVWYCVCGQMHLGFSKPETQDDQPGPLTPQGLRHCLQVRWQSSLQCGSSWPEKRCHKSQSRLQQEDWVTHCQQQATGGVAGTTEHHELQRLGCDTRRPEWVAGRGAQQFLCSLWNTAATLLCSSLAPTPVRIYAYDCCPGHKNNNIVKSASTDHSNQSSGRTIWTVSCCWPSTARPLRACWRTVSPPGTGAALRLTETEYSQSSTEDSWLSSPLPDGHLLHPVPQQRSQHHQGQFTSQFSAVWAVAVW